ncbi:MAG: hypothetical protein KAH48_10405, partial [Chlorobi bacterium]|nr:hypothetical protein [Chlorobiota bacterium]
MKNILLVLVFMIVAPNCLPAKSLEFEWAKQISSDESVFISAVVNDSEGNVYVSGNFSTNAIFSNSTSFTSAGRDDMFIAKYKFGGIFEWAKHIKTTDRSSPTSICIDEFEMIYLCGAFSGSADFDSLSYENKTWARPSFISKYSPDGIEQWVHILNPKYYCQVQDIHCDRNGNLYVIGDFNHRTVFGNDIILYDSVAQTGFIAKYNYENVCQWAKSIKGSKYNSGTRIRTDGNNNIYIGGVNKSDLDFGNDINISYNGRYIEEWDKYDDEHYLAKFNDNGDCQWAEKIGDSVSHGRTVFSIDDIGNIYLSGRINKSRLDFGNNMNVIDSKDSLHASYMAKLNTDGICQWAKRLIGSDIKFYDSKLYQDKLYYSGTFRDSINIGNEGKIVHPNSYNDGFILNTDKTGSIVWGLTLSDKVTSSHINDISVFNRNCIYASGFFTRDLLIDNKFDFKIRGNANAFVTKLTPGVIINGENLICEDEESVLTATAGFDKYLWSTGETTQSIVVTETGEYSVKVTDKYNTEFNSESFYVRIFANETDGLCDVSMTVENINDIDQRSMKFENKGSDPISVKSIELKDMSEFLSVSTSVSLPAVLNPGEFIDIVLTYAPEANNPVSDSLIVIVDDPCPVRFANYIEGFTSVCHLTSFIYPDFSSKDKLNLIDSRTTDSSIVLTWAKQKKSGAIWRNHRVPVKNGFYCKFRFRLHDGQNYDNEDGSLPGADGIAFVIQNSGPKTLGGNGGRIGYAGIENALAVELDLFSNDENQIEDYFDPDGNHIAVQTGGSGIISSKHTEENNLGITSDIPTIRADGTIYSMVIEYNLDSEVMNIYLGENISSASPVLTITDLELDEILELDKGEGAFVGITAATGAAAQTHEILDWEFCAANSNYPDTASCHPLSFSYTDYTSVDKLNFVGTCRNANNSVVLNNSSKYATGVLWRNQRVPVKNGFYTKYRFRISKGDNRGQKEYSEPGADGIVFVIQNSNPRAIGSVGSQIGYGGIENALAVELDLFTNDINQVDNFLDPNGNHIAVQSSGHGPIKCIHDSKNNFGIASNIPIVKSDGTIYTMLIEYNLEPDVMNIYLSDTDDLGSPLLTVTDLRISDLLDLHLGEGAYVGFTSSTGEAIQSHE